MIDLVIDAAAHRLGLEDDLVAEAVACLHHHLIAVGDDAAARQPIQPRSAVRTQLVFDERLRGFGGERAVRHVLAAEFAFHAVQGARVARQLSDAESGIKVAEQGIELLFLDLDIKFAHARRVMLRAGGVAVDRVVLLAVYHLVKPRARVAGSAAPFLVGIVRHGEQEVARHLPLGIERHAAVFPQFFVGVALRQIFDAAGELALADGAFAEADEYPFAHFRLQPRADQLRRTAREIKRQHHFARIRRRLQTNQRNAVFGHAPFRHVADVVEQRTAIAALRHLKRLIGRGYLQRPVGAVTRGFAVAIKNAHGNHRRGVAVGNQRRGAGNKTAFDRAARIVQHAFGARDFLA